MTTLKLTNRAATKWAAGGLLALGAVVGGTSVAHAASTAPASTSSSSTSSTSGTQASRPAHGSAAEEALEKTVTGAQATTAGNAAIKAIGSGTVTKVTTDSTGQGFEVTVKKSDGSTVEVHMDANYNINTHGGPGASTGTEAAPQG